MNITYILIENFMGIKHFEHSPNGKSFSIHGKNESGKTTFGSAIYCLLFGKNIEFKEKFQIQPIDPKTNEYIPDITTRLKIGFDNGLLLGKEISQKWTKKRGKTKKVLTGMKTVFTIGEDEVKATKFKEACKTIVEDEEAFKILTNPYYFSSVIPWKERKKTALSFADNVVFPMPEDVEEILQGDDIDLVRARLQKKLKENVKENTFETQIKTLQKQDDGQHVPDEKINIVDMENSLQILRDKQTALLNGEEVQSLRNERFELEGQLEKIANDKKVVVEDLETKQERLMVIYEKSVSDLAKREKELLAINENRRVNRENAERDIATNDIEGKQVNEKLSELREEYKTMVANTDLSCYACGTKLTKKQVEESQVKAANEINARGKEYTEKLNNLNILNGQLKTIVNMSQHDSTVVPKPVKSDQLLEIENKLSELSENKDERIYPLETKIVEINAKIKTIQDNSEEIRKKIDNDISELEKEKTSAIQINTKIDFRANMAKEIKELKKKEKKFDAEAEKIEGDIETLADFNKNKTLVVSDTIPNNFGGIKFRMFRAKFSGDDEECCEVLGDNGVDFSGCSHSQQIKLGSRIINELSEKRYNGLKLPLVVDYAGEITEMPQTDGLQVIRLVVDPEADVLTVK